MEHLQVAEDAAALLPDDVVAGLLRGWDATVHPDGVLEVTGPDGQVFVAGSPGAPPGGERWRDRSGGHR